MPQSSTHSSGCRRARVTSIRYAVSKTSGNAAASSNESPSGNRVDVRRRAPRSARAFVPSPCSPITWIAPSGASTPGLITTRSPGSKPVTPSPSASTTPAPSAPRMRGFGTEGRPLRIQTSRWLSAEARRRISTSPGPGSGSGTSSSTSTSGPPSSWIRTACTGGTLSACARAELERLGRGARARRRRRDARPRRTTGPSGTSASAGRAGSSPT